MSRITMYHEATRAAQAFCDEFGWTFDRSCFMQTAPPYQKAIALQRAEKMDAEAGAIFLHALGKTKRS